MIAASGFYLPWWAEWILVAFIYWPIMLVGLAAIGLIVTAWLYYTRKR